MIGCRSRVPNPVNEPVLGYLKGSPEREELQKTLQKMRSEVLEIPVIIGGKEIRTGNLGEARIPHDHKHLLAKWHKAGKEEIKLAIETALKAREMWSKMPNDERFSIFLKMAELLSGPYRQILNASTILGQSKNFFQAEIDSACELIDFFRFNVKYAEEIYEDQPLSSKGVWNRVSFRPLEGFVYALTPFNFTSIAGNLPTAPAIMGNVVVWKPAQYAIYSAYYLMKLFKDAGLPDGVINFVPGDPELVTNTCITHPDFAGIHYTGSTEVFRDIWKTIGNNIANYKNYPRIVGETGGKDFIFAHHSADVNELVTALIRGAFEYAGQKCSAASRAYIPNSLWPKLRDVLVEQLKTVKVGNPEEPDTFVNAVIHRRAWTKTKDYIEFAKKCSECEIVFGGTYDDSIGYFITPTVIRTTNPFNKLMLEEIFAPVLTIYVYKDGEYVEALRLCDKTSPYALTGSIFAKDREAIRIATNELENSAGNFYINDKPTGAVVGQQPFGGARASGTNDKAGSKLNLLRWVNCRAIKETFAPPTHYMYPYMKSL
jgi:1-pyrroline-5-carboxylate dehydrogenase